MPIYALAVTLNDYPTPEPLDYIIDSCKHNYILESLIICFSGSNKKFFWDDVWSSSLETSVPSLEFAIISLSSIRPIRQNWVQYHVKYNMSWGSLTSSFRGGRDLIFSGLADFWGQRSQRLLFVGDRRPARRPIDEVQELMCMLLGGCDESSWYRPAVVNSGEYREVFLCACPSMYKVGSYWYQ